MSTNAVKLSGRNAKARRATKPAAPRIRTKTFRVGSALILDQHGGTIGLIEARTP